MGALWHGFYTAPGVFPGFKRIIIVRRRLIISWKAVGIVFYVNDCVWDGLVVMVGAHANFGWQWYELWRGRPTRPKSGGEQPHDRHYQQNRFVLLYKKGPRALRQHPHIT